MKLFPLVPFFLLCSCLALPMAAQTDIASHGSGAVDIWGTAMDSSGNSVMSGKLQGSANLDVQGGSYVVSAMNAMVVAKYDSSQTLLWAHTWTSVDAGYTGSPNTPQIGSEGATFDAAGNVYIVGYFRGRVDFDPAGLVAEESALDPTGAPAPNCAFILKLDANGNFVWVRAWRAGGGSAGGAIGLGVRCRGNRVFVNGIFGPDILLDPENHTEPAHSYSIATYICVLTDAGNYVWATGFASYLSLTENVSPDASGGLAFAMSYIVDIQIGHLPGSPQYYPTGNADTLVLRYDANGSLLWMRELSGTGANVVGVNSAIDANGDYYISGQWRGTADFDPGAGTESQTATGSSLDAFVVKLTSAGYFAWCRTMTSLADVNTNCITVDGPAVLLGGTCAGTVEFDSGPGSTVLSGGSGWLTRLDQGGTHVWSAVYPTGSTVVGAHNKVGFIGGADTMRWVDTRSALHIYTPTLPTVMQGSPTQEHIVAVAGSDAGYSWTLVSGSLPPGITGLPATSTPLLPLGGTPTTAGTFSFRVRVQDSAGGADERDFTWTIDPTPPLIIAPGAISNVQAGSAASHTFNASGGTNSTFNWSIVSGNLPTGVNGIPGTGTPTINASGTPTTPGNYTFRLRAEDSIGNYDEVDFSWTIDAPPVLMIVTPASVPFANVGDTVSFLFEAAGGSGTNYIWTLVSGSLPAGITGIPGNGTPSVAVNGILVSGGMSTFRLRVQDSIGGSDERDFTWQIASLPVEGGGGGAAGGGGCAAGVGSLGVLAAPLLLLLRRRRRSS